MLAFTIKIDFEEIYVIITKPDILKHVISIWWPQGCHSQAFSFCLITIKTGTDIEKWCFYKMIYNCVCIWNKTWVSAHQKLVKEYDFRQIWRTGPTATSVKQIMQQTAKNMCTKFEVNLSITSWDIVTSVLCLSGKAILRKSRKNVRVTDYDVFRFFQNCTKSLSLDFEKL